MNFVKWIKFKIHAKKFMNDLLVKILKPLASYLEKKEQKYTSPSQYELQKVAKKVAKHYYARQYASFNRNPRYYLTNYISYEYVGEDCGCDVQNVIFDFIPSKLTSKYKLYKLKQDEKKVLVDLLLMEFKKLNYSVNEMYTNKNKVYYQLEPNFN